MLKMRKPKILLWLGWLYVLLIVLWLILRLFFVQQVWAILLINLVVDFLFLPLPLFVILSFWKNHRKLLWGLTVPTIVLITLISLPLLNSSQSNAAIDTKDTLFTSGWDEVFALKPTETPTKLWSWKAATSAGMPASMVTKFATTDDCKPIEQGRKILVTSSTGGVALVEQTSGKTLFYATVPGAHSAELLPNDRIAVASASALIGGHKLVLFDLKHSEKRLWESDFHDGHGVYWDVDQNILWALGYNELREYELMNWESNSPALTLKETYQLPSTGGHDLSPNSDRATLFVTTSSDVVLFNKRSHSFASEPRMKGLLKVKGVSVHPETKRVAYIQAEEKWWSPRIHFLEPKQTILLNGERLYKARWIY
jgi:hypothetical protein